MDEEETRKAGETAAGAGGTGVSLRVTVLTLPAARGAGAVGGCVLLCGCWGSWAGIAQACPQMRSEGGALALVLLRRRARVDAWRVVAPSSPTPPPTHLFTPLLPYPPNPAGNAVRMAAAVAEAALAASPGARLCSIQGGDKRNAIPRECLATIAVSNRVMCATCTVFQSKFSHYSAVPSPSQGCTCFPKRSNGLF